jgi:ribosome maturation factor RimP
MQVEQKICAIIEPSLLELGYEVVQIKYFNLGRSNILQIMIERSDGKAIIVSDCEKASHTISTLLDVEDPISGSYNLEVSSAGIDRPLVKPKDYLRYKGYEILVVLYRPINNSKRHQGILEDVIDDEIALNVKGITHKIGMTDIDSAKLVINDKLLKNNLDN